MIIKKRQLLLATLIIALAAAVFVNWYYTRPEIERILKVGFEYAMKRNKHLTVVDKANVLASSRLWRQIAKEMEPQ